jgi:hypothetical protein
MRVQRRPTSTTGLHATGLCAVRPRVAMDEMLRRSKCGRSVEPRHRRLWFYWRWPARMQLAMEFAGGVGGEADLLYTGLNGSRDVFAPGASASEDFRSRWARNISGTDWMARRPKYELLCNRRFGWPPSILIPLSTSTEPSTTCQTQQHVPGGR